jgi:hypothetical protein
VTAAFALGQIVGPLLVRGSAGAESHFDGPLLSAAIILLVSGVVLLWRPRRTS